MSQRSTLKFFRLRRADYLLKNTSVSCTFWEPDPAGAPAQRRQFSVVNKTDSHLLEVTQTHIHIHTYTLTRVFRVPERRA